MAFGIVSWNPSNTITFNAFAAIWDYDGLPLAEQTRTAGWRHVRVMIDDSKIPQFKQAMKLHGLEFKRM